MTDPERANEEQQVDVQHLLLLAPTRKDADLTGRLLAPVHIQATVCDDLTELLDRVDPSVGTALIAEERLTGNWRSAFDCFLNQQPLWSDFPFLVLTRKDEITSPPLQYLQQVANVTRISRPIRIRAFISNVEACLRDRARQRTVRDLLASVEDREQQWRQLADAMPNIVFSASADGQLDYVNQHAHDYIGDTANNDNCQWVDAIHVEDRERAVARWQHSLRTGKKHHVELRVRSGKSGKYRWHITRAVPIRDDDGSITRWYGTCTDIHEQKLHQRQLNQALHEAAQANVAKSQFIANMSHEIRTPMTAVLGYAELLTSKETDPEKLEYLRTIRRNGMFLTDIINDILDLSKIEAGKLDITLQPIKPDAIVFDVHSMMHVRAVEKQLDFDIEFRSKIPKSIKTDPKRLRQILINLVGNAIKFTPSGSVKLLVRFEKGQMIYEVVDTGIGISKQHQSRLFEAFSQGDASVDREYGGTGLGLAISQRLAKMLGGQIEVESSPEKGSLFRTRIEVGEVREGDLIYASKDAIQSTPEADQKLAALSCRVLVVDDRRDIRMLAGHLLRRAGADVEFAEDGLEGTEIIKSSLGSPKTFDIILMDMQMPRMDGYRAAAVLREMGYDRPIIALTADAMQGDMDRCITSGCNSYLSKPIDAKELIRVVSTFTSENTAIHDANRRHR